jgi:hypothetical protein
VFPGCAGAPGGFEAVPPEYAGAPPGFEVVPEGYAEMPPGFEETLSRCEETPSEYGNPLIFNDLGKMARPGSPTRPHGRPDGRDGRPHPNAG